MKNLMLILPPTAKRDTSPPVMNHLGPHDWSDCGFFYMRGKYQQPLRILATRGEGWDHVSVSLKDRCPTWEEMCQVKDAFFDPEEAVMQLHPPASDYVNFHPYCLHLWKPHGLAIPLPPSNLVGPK